ncbi:hypothetical protein OH764_36040 (plasmid) [Burkholderia sp. M6-3]
MALIVVVLVLIVAVPCALFAGPLSTNNQYEASKELRLLGVSATLYVARSAAHKLRIVMRGHDLRYNPGVLECKERDIARLITSLSAAIVRAEHFTQEPTTISFHTSVDKTVGLTTKGSAVWITLHTQSRTQRFLRKYTVEQAREIVQTLETLPELAIEVAANLPRP